MDSCLCRGPIPMARRLEPHEEPTCTSPQAGWAICIERLTTLTVTMSPLVVPTYSHCPSAENTSDVNTRLRLPDVTCKGRAQAMLQQPG